MRHRGTRSTLPVMATTELPPGPGCSWARRQRVTHVLLAEGHQEGRRTVGAVARLGGQTQLSISKRQVKDLPPA
jgi:hypothetical protein